MVGIVGFLNHSSSTPTPWGFPHVSLRCSRGYVSHPSALGNSLGFPRGKGPLGSQHHPRLGPLDSHHPRLVIHVKLMDENGKPRPIRGSPFRPTLTKYLGPYRWRDDDFHREKLGEEMKNKGGFFWGGWIFWKDDLFLLKMNYIYIYIFFRKEKHLSFWLQFFLNDCLNWRSTRWPSFLSSLYRFLKKGGRPWLPVLCNCSNSFTIGTLIEDWVVV